MNNRYQISKSQSTKKLHEYYRSYFDKPPNHRQEYILRTNRPVDPYPNLHSTLEKFSNRIPSKDRKKSSQFVKELGWDQNFHVTVSKDNLKFHKSSREYFDSPMIIDYRAPRSPISLTRKSQGLGLSTKGSTFRPYDSLEKFYWNSLYEPISERNVVKHRAQRVYFS